MNKIIRENKWVVKEIDKSLGHAPMCKQIHMDLLIMKSKTMHMKKSKYSRTPLFWKTVQNPLILQD